MRAPRVKVSNSIEKSSLPAKNGRIPSTTRQESKSPILSRRRAKRYLLRGLQKACKCTRSSLMPPESSLSSSLHGWAESCTSMKCKDHFRPGSPGSDPSDAVQRAISQQLFHTLDMKRKNCLLTAVYHMTFGPFLGLYDVSFRCGGGRGQWVRRFVEL